MKKLIFLFVYTIFIISCNSQSKKEEKTDNNSNYENVSDSTSQKSYFPNGNIKTIFYKSYKGENDVQLTYNENKILVKKIVGFASLPIKIFNYDNSGELINSYSEDSYNGCQMKVGIESFYQKNTLIKTIDYENLTQNNGESCDQTFTITKIREFQNNQLVKESFEKTFYESGYSCPCGESKNFRNKQIITKETHPPCRNFKLECSENEEENSFNKLKENFSSGKVNINDFLGTYKFDNNNFEQLYREYTLIIDKNKCIIYQGNLPACEIICVPKRINNEIEFYYDSQATDRSKYDYSLVEKNEHGDLLLKLISDKSGYFVKSPIIEYWNETTSEFDLNQKINVNKQK